MAERTVNVNIQDIIKKYIEEISKYYKIDAIILFGSYANGTNSKDSDIDIAIITSDLKDDIIDEEFKLMKLRRKIDIRIEPHIIRTKDFEEKSDPFIQEVIETGIKVA